MGSCAPLASPVSNPYTTVRSAEDHQGISLHSIVDSYPSPVGDQGWTTVETVLIQLSTTSTPSGRFPVVSTGTGFDAAVCVQKYEPWIVGVYNTSIAPPSALGIIKRGEGSTSLLPSGNIRGAQIGGTTRYLNATQKYSAFVVAHTNSIHRMKEVSSGDPDFLYRPFLTVGPVVPPVYDISSNPNLLHRPFLSPMALEFWDTPNSLQAGSPPSAHGSARLTLYHTSRDRDPSSHNHTWMRH